MSKELNTKSLSREKAELLLSNLEKLKSEVSAIETRYNIPTADYVKICDEAILKISAVKTAFEGELSNKVGDLEAVKPEISNLEARFKLGLVSVETYLKERGTPPPEGLQAVVNKTADSIELGLDKMGDGVIFFGERLIKACTSTSKVITKKRH
jgi:hypothetical protein